ncbi:hypothetical protein [Gracilibacillus salinarum]|uniref:Uncharacterized protein n=1 Tax=Gracilibacillus salinarum TaxID=2932255 RepID=A0ABY4GM18_9BACI|nr:hypothetical protein [Gracilibacillus salinarum]UOQ85420.1 hypothetical protein MUN87_00495 [Gracilibacillus salinarum]
MKYTITILLLLFLLSCSHNETNETMITNDKEMENTEQSFTEETNIENTPAEEENRELEFVLEQETVTLNTENIPILKEYLSVMPYQQQDVADMALQKLEIEGLYLLSFNCNDTTCSYLLLDRNEPNRSFLLDDLVLIEEILPSPEQNHFLFLFKQSDTEQYTVFNIEDWKVLDPQPKLTETKEITEAAWLDEETFDIFYHTPENQETLQQTISLLSDGAVGYEDN